MNKRDTEATGNDSDFDRQLWGRTIGLVLAEGSLSKISDGEFNVSFLAKYQHRQQLDECCRLAVEELAEEPFEGRASCARVMGRAMELLRETYHLKVPGGWVPVLRTLRAAPESSLQSRQSTEGVADQRSATVPAISTAATAIAQRSKNDPGIVVDGALSTEAKILPVTNNSTSSAVADAHQRLREAEALSDLCTELYEVADQPFHGKLRLEIRTLLEEFSAAEISAAWREYTAPMDAYECKFAPKKFCEGAARDIVNARRHRAKKSAEQQALIEKLLQHERANVEAELAAGEKPAEEEMHEI